MRKETMKTLNGLVGKLQVTEFMNVGDLHAGERPGYEASVCLTVCTDTIAFVLTISPGYEAKTHTN